MPSYRGGRLHLEGVAAEALARRFGTPLYAYSAAAVRGRLEALERAFGASRPLICYALKANSNRSLCRLLSRRGAGAEVVSGGELERALKAGFSPRRIVFSGVGKTKEELALALRRGVLSLNVESSGELAALEDVARRLKRRAPVSVRLNPDVDAGTHPHITTGRAENKFGVGEEEALVMYAKAARSPWLEAKGIQCHIGSQVFAVEPFAAAARAVSRVARRLQGLGIALELMDFGGGFGVGYEDERSLDLRALAAALRKTMKPWPRARLIIEPGRFLVADAGVLLTRVLYLKQGARRRFVIVDAAMNDLARPALYGAAHPVLEARKTPGKKRPADIVGPVCESGDFLARNAPLGPCAPGDLLAVLKAGAYGFAMSSQYNSRPRAAEALVEGTKARLIRRRETLEDLTRGEL